MEGGQARYQCPKCGHRRYESGELRGAGGFWSKIFDVQARKFTTVSCASCGYTELFERDSSTLGHIFDFFTD